MSGRAPTLAELGDITGARVLGDAATVVTDVSMDSRTVPVGSLFCCVRGAQHDGHDHAAAAVEGGAVALACTRELPLGVPQLLLEDTRAAAAVLADRVHGHPSGALDVIGVTGTNGKTTVVAMLAAVLEHAGRRVATIGTLTGERTTPEAPELQRRLASLVASGTDAVAMEVSSHALVLHRVDAVSFRVGVFTMLGVDHLDFHGTPEAYFAAKAQLFEPGRCVAAVVNADDVHGRLLRDAGDGTVRGIGFGAAEDLVEDANGSRFRWRGRSVRLALAGRHNVTNALLAAEACIELGLDPGVIAEGLSTLEGVPGRFERFGGDGLPVVIVDYAHTPDALEAVLGASRALVAPGGSMTVVFGCGGDRDSGKRPLMGEVATRLADRVVLTDDNPRSEDPVAIVAAVLAGCERPPEVLHDRRQAISAAVGAAGPSDLVIVAGKGHETGQQVGAEVVPFDDREVVSVALARLGDAR